MRELMILFLGASPVLELRGALPVALLVFNFSIIKALSLSVMGNILPIIPILFFLGPIEVWLKKHIPRASRVLAWFSQRAQSSHRERFENWGAVALFFLTAIPLPFTGAWSAALAAFLFKIPPAKAFPAIFLGVVCAGLIVVSFILGVGSIF